MKKHIPLVSIVAVNYNGKRFLKDCFTSLEKSDYPKEKKEIIMVDNGSSDGSVEYVRKNFPRVKVLLNKENNYCSANNKGIKASRGEYVALINNDVKIDSHWIRPLVETAQDNSSIGAVGSKILFMDGSVQSAGHQEYPDFYWGDIGFRQKNTKAYSLKGEVPSICGCAVMYRKKCLDDVGLLDEDFVMFVEDVDMGIRLRQKGWKLVMCTESIVYHLFHGSIGDEANAQYFQEVNRLLLVAKHWPDKLPDALSGKYYFTIKETYRSPRDIGEVMGKVFAKLLKEHGQEAVDRLSPALFESVRKIYDFEKDYLLQSMRIEHEEKVKYSKALEAAHQDNARLNREYPLAMQEKDRELAKKKDELYRSEKELSRKAEECSRLTDDIEGLKRKQEKEFDSLAAQKEQEIMALRQEKAHALAEKEEQAAFKDQEITCGRAEIEALKSQYAGLLEEKEKQREESIAGLTEESAREISLLNEEKDREIALLKEGFSIREEQAAALVKEKEKELDSLAAQKEQEITCGRAEIEALKSQYAGLLEEKDKQREESITGLTEESAREISLLIEEKDREIALLKEGFSSREKEFTRAARNKESEIAEKNAELLRKAEECSRLTDEIEGLKNKHESELVLLTRRKEHEIAKLDERNNQRMALIQEESSRKEQELRLLRKDIVAQGKKYQRELKTFAAQKEKDIAFVIKQRDKEIAFAQRRREQEVALIEKRKEKELSVIIQRHDKRLALLTNEKKKEIESLRREQQAVKEAFVAEHNKNILELNLQLSSRDNEIALLKARVAAFSQQVLGFTQQLTAQRCEEESLRAAFAVLGKEKEKAQARIQALTEELALAKQSGQGTIAELLTQKEQALIAFASDKGAMAREAELQRKESESAISSLKQEIEIASSNYHKELAIRSSQILSKEQEMGSLREKLDEVMSEYARLISKLSQEKEEELARLKVAQVSEVNNLRAQIAQVKNELLSVYNSTAYRRLVKPLWDLLWPIKKKAFAAKHKLISSLQGYLDKKKSIGRNLSRVFSNFYELYYRSINVNGFSSTYLNHLRFNTFPVLPQRLTLMINRICNLKCRFCDIAAVPGKELVLSKENACAIISSARKLGVKHMVITGGEPFIHPDLFEIVDFAYAKGLEVAVTTNGMFIKKYVDKILKSHFKCICVSIDGNEETHDYLRDCAGSFKAAMEGIQLLHDNHFNVSVNFVVTNKNVFELEKIYSLFTEMRIPMSFLPVVNKPEFFLSQAAEKEEYKRFISKLRDCGELTKIDYFYLKNAAENYSNSREAHVRCLGLNLELGIDTDGNISPCCIWENKKKELNAIGNALREDLEALWYSREFNEARRSIFYKGCAKCFNPSILDMPKEARLSYIVRSHAGKSKFEPQPVAKPPPLLKLPKPNHLHFRFTSRCNLRCRHCDIWKEKYDPAKELSVEQWKACINKLDSWIGKFLVDLAGGEILLYRGATELISHCSQRGNVVNLTTNGTLIDDTMAKRLVDTGINCINLSLDGLSDTHKYTRNNDEAFERVRRAVECLAKYRVQPPPYLCISTVITRYNLSQLAEIIRFPEVWGVNNVSFQALDHNFGAVYDEQWFKDNEFWPKDYKDVEAAIDMLKDAKKSGARIFNSFEHLNAMKAYYRDPIVATRNECQSGMNNFIVNEFGEALLCWNMPAVGNLLTEDPEAIWNSIPAKKMRVAIERCSRTCRMLNCNFA